MERAKLPLGDRIPFPEVKPHSAVATRSQALQIGPLPGEGALVLV